MPKTRARVPMSDFTGGLNQDDQPSALAANELRAATNVALQGRALSARRGLRQLNGPFPGGAPAGVGIYEYVRAAGTQRTVLAVFGNQLYKDARTSAVGITGGVTITPGQDNLVDFVTFNDIALMCNGVNPPWQWTGTGDATVIPGSPPNFRTMAAKWNRVFGAATGRTIRFCALGDPATWPPANTVAAILGDASAAIEGRDFIYQISHLGDSLFVGLANSVGRVLYTGDSVSPFRYLQLAEFGQLGSHSYVPVGSNGYFLSRWGVHFVQPTATALDYETSMISGRRLRTLWASLNKTRIAYSYGALYSTVGGNAVVVWPLTTGTGTAPNTVLVMDVTDGPGQERFFVWTGWNANATGVAQHPTTLADELLFVSTTSYVYQGDIGYNDQGAAYVTEATTRWEDFGSPAEKKNFRDLYVEFQQSAAFGVTINTFFDYETTPTQTFVQSVRGQAQSYWGSSAWGGSAWSTHGYVRKYLMGVDDGVVLSFRITTRGANEPWTLLKLVPSVEAIGEAQES